MSDWSHGYDVSTEYSFGFFREMAPDWLDFCAWIGGFEPPQRRGSFRYLDLGCGQGFGVCLLAAANPHAEFVGVDFQPEHIAHAQGLAEAARLTNVRFVQADFLDLAADWPRDLGTFDYVALHGILSWVVPALREAVVRCLSHATAPGGLVYVSYNAQPGCLSSIPLQHFSAQLETSEGDATSVEKAIALLDRLAAANAPVFQVLPALKRRVDALKTRDRNYLVHEYLTQGWTPFWHSEVAREFKRADLDYVASATLGDNLVTEFLPAPQREAVVEQQTPEIRQDIQDFIVNQAFRRDIFCRGAEPASGNQPAKQALKVHLTESPEPGASLNFETSFGQIAWDPSVFTPIVQALGDGPRSLDDLFRLPNATRWRPRHILLLLLHANVLAPEVAEPADAAPAHRLNAAIARAACEGASYEYVAASRLGSAVRASRMELLLLDAWLESRSVEVSALCAALVQRLWQPGREPKNEGELESIAAEFIADTLPRWRRLGVVE